jgi:hypothetical protein
MTMFATNVSCYLWDLVDEGIDDVLDRLRGETGATGVSVAVSCPRVGLLRPHRGVSPRTFRSEGGLQFQPGKDAYVGTRIRPVVAEWLRKANPLAAVAQGCQQRDLALRGRVVCCHSPVLASRYESCAVKDVFGDLHPAWLCPSNPDVREYVRALLADLSASYPFETLELEAASFPPPGEPHWQREICPAGGRASRPPRPSRATGLNNLAPCSPAEPQGEAPESQTPLGAAGDWLLSLCFCESCRQAAAGEGVDAAAAARSATVLLERALASGEPVPKSVEALLASDQILNDYAAWGCRQVTGLIALLRQACRCRLSVLRSGGPLTTGSDFAAIAAHCDALLTPPPEPTDAVEPAIQAAAAGTRDIAKVEIGVTACTPACPDSAALVRALSTAARLGVGTAVVDNYGLLPMTRLAWIKQAARYAARESE